MEKKKTDTPLEDIEISAGGEVSFKDIVMMQLRKVVQLSCVEFRGGYYSIITTKKGEEKEVYVQDTREVFSNGIYALALLLKPSFRGMKGMTERFKTFKKKLKRISKDFIDVSSVDEEVILGESFYESEKDKILFETYRNKKLKLYLALFTELCMFLKKENYMEIIGSSEEDVAFEEKEECEK